jgi:hypothetical protein
MSVVLPCFAAACGSEATAGTATGSQHDSSSRSRMERDALAAVDAPQAHARGTCIGDAVHNVASQRAATWNGQQTAP